jgi:hypothetical protein
MVHRRRVGSPTYYLPTLLFTLISLQLRNTEHGRDLHPVVNRKFACPKLMVTSLTLLDGYIGLRRLKIETFCGIRPTARDERQCSIDSAAEAKRTWPRLGFSPSQLVAQAFRPESKWRW